ncbi:ABC transporter permease [Nonomuraea sp. SBT364]|uniref:ABC transporter permease n=1 Tax=Nonomuraea sp. SBT364 TaxID=1580530 RepID=UPI0007C7FD50|nr:ABC transporter permease [Nonomuraea sp. SBT364]
MMDIVRSEWTKIRSVRSTVWTLACTGLLMIGFSVLLGVSIVNSQGNPPMGLEAARVSLSGTLFAQLAVATFGVLVISGEYRTGSIRGSFMAVPQRLRLLTAKVLVFTVVTAIVSTVSSVAAFLVGGQFIIGTTTLGDPGVSQAVFGTALYLTASGLFGLALGALVRHTPGAVVSVMALILVLPQLTSMLPGAWGSAVHHHFTSNAGLQVVAANPSNPLGPWSGYGVYLAWVAVTLVAAAVLMRRRDA